MANVVLERLSKTYAGGHAAVREVSLDVQDQEFVVLVGPSGCGKTTTLRMIAGLEEISAGEIKINGRVVNHIAPKDRDIAMVFQNYALYPHMTVYKNMAFGLELRQGVGWPRRIWRRLTDRGWSGKWRLQREEIQNRVRQTAAMLGIERLLARFPRELSGGERQRVALGRAIVRQPQAFLFDEPLSNLDARLRVDMRRELKRLHQQLKITVIYVTHDQVEALTLGDRIVVMNEGRVQQVGRPMEVYDKPSNLFVAGFLGAPPMNLMSGRLEKRDGGCVFSGSGVRVEGVGGGFSGFSELPRDVVLGVRPENVAIRPLGGLAEKRGESSGVKPVAAKILSVENLGDAMLVHVSPAAMENQKSVGESRPLVCRTHERASWVAGQAVQLEIQEKNIHWFDETTGRRLMFDS